MADSATAEMPTRPLVTTIIIPYYIIPCTINSIIKTYVITLVVYPPIIINYNATKPPQDDDENDDDDHDYDDHDHDYDGSGEDG